MITATFSLVQQLTRLHAMPAVKIIHTADDVEGQIYAPAVNILLMIGTIALSEFRPRRRVSGELTRFSRPVAAGFGTDIALTNAYGFAVSGVMIVTTSFLAIGLVYIKGFPFGVGIWFFVFAGFFDALFWGASLKKVPHGELLLFVSHCKHLADLGSLSGAWFPLGMAALLAGLFILYSWAKKLENTFDSTHRRSLTDVMCAVGAAQSEEGSRMLASSHGEKATEVTGPLPVQAPSYEAVGRSTALSRLPIFAFFHNPSANTLGGAPHSFSAFLRCYPSLPQVIVSCCLLYLLKPYFAERRVPCHRSSSTFKSSASLTRRRRSATSSRASEASKVGSFRAFDFSPSLTLVLQACMWPPSASVTATPSTSLPSPRPFAVASLSWRGIPAKGMSPGK
jgi:KUP system potassium uptake protein